MKRIGLFAMWLALCAHVGSPDTYFEGTAGPYPLRVVVRNPTVVPGLAQISVRLLGRQVVRRVLVLPVFWDPRTAAPIIVTAPTNKNAPNASSAAPSGFCRASRLVATAMTGTRALPEPASPSTVTCTP